MPLKEVSSEKGIITKVKKKKTKQHKAVVLWFLVCGASVWTRAYPPAPTSAHPPSIAVFSLLHCRGDLGNRAASLLPLGNQCLADWGFSFLFLFSFFFFLGKLLGKLNSPNSAKLEHFRSL